MIFRVFEKTELKKLFDVLASANKVIGPVVQGQDKNNEPIHGFEHVTKFENLALDYTITKLPAKRYFLPFIEDLATFKISGANWDKQVDFNVEGPVVLFGLHACDINALNRLDKVLMESVYPVPYYAAKRKNMFIVGTDCEPRPTCFCRSMGAHTALHGFDLFITDIGPRYFAEILTDTAFNILKSIKTSEPIEADHVLYMKTAKARDEKFTTKVDTTDLTKILDMEFQSDVWKIWGDRCLACGTCANVCPTCYCYGVDETVDIDFKGAKKTKRLHSCNLIDFAKVAGGHNFREGRDARIKYRYYHKHRGFVEAYEEPLCVGCGRCGISCLADITVPEVIASVRGEGEGSWITR